MATSREILEIIGSREPFPGLMEQTSKSFEVGTRYKEPLGRYGFTEEKLQELGRLRNEAATYQGTRKSKAEASKDQTRKQTAAVQALKNHFFVLNTALPTVFRDNAIEGFSQDSFAPIGKLDNSPKKVLDHADRIRDLVLKINEPLRPFFGGESPIEVHDRLRNALDAANATQEANREALPQHTKEINIIKGRLVELIDDLNRAGQIAFVGQAEIAACFNKDILLRARRGGGTKQAEDPTPGTTENQE